MRLFHLRTPAVRHFDVALSTRLQQRRLFNPAPRLEPLPRTQTFQHACSKGVYFTHCGSIIRRLMLFFNTPGKGVYFNLGAMFQL